MIVKSGKNILIISLVMILICSVFSVASAGSVEIKFEFDKTEYTVGEEIKVKYSVSGGSGDYPTLHYTCYTQDDGTTVEVDSDYLTSAKGTIKFTPTVGQKAYVSIIGTDSDGRYFNWDSEWVPLSGGESAEKITVKFTFDKESYTVGDEIAVKYKISGGSNEYSAMYNCYTNDNGTTVEIDSDFLTSTKGTIKFKPTVGQEAYVSIVGSDSEGRHFNADSERVPLSGGKTADRPTVKFTFDKESYSIGDEISVKFKITGGSGEYPFSSYTCYTRDNGETVEVAGDFIFTAKGTIKFTPTVGQEAYVTIAGSDSDGRHFSGVSDRVSLSGAQLIDISGAAITVKDQTYTGKKLEPELKVKVNGKKLKSGTDYTVKWKNNKKVGIAEATLTGKGQYSGSAETTFVIKPSKVALSSLEAGSGKLTVKWKKSNGIDGYEIEYSLKKNFKKADTVTISKAKTTSAKLTDLKKGKTYYVRIRAFKTINGQKYYSDWSDSMKAKVKK